MATSNKRTLYVGNKRLCLIPNDTNDQMPDIFEQHPYNINFAVTDMLSLFNTKET